MKKETIQEQITIKERNICVNRNDNRYADT